MVAICYFRPDTTRDKAVKKPISHALGIFHLQDDQVVNQKVIEAKGLLTACLDSAGTNVVLVETVQEKKEALVRIVNTRTGSVVKSFSIPNFIPSSFYYKSPVHGVPGPSLTLARAGDTFVLCGMDADAKEVKATQTQGEDKQEISLGYPGTLVRFTLKGDVQRLQLPDFVSWGLHMVTDEAAGNKIMLRGIVPSQRAPSAAYTPEQRYAVYDLDAPEKQPRFYPEEGTADVQYPLVSDTNGSILGISKKKLVGLNSKGEPSRSRDVANWPTHLEGKGQLEVHLPFSPVLNSDMPVFFYNDTKTDLRQTDRSIPAVLNLETSTLAMKDPLEAAVRKVVPVISRGISGTGNENAGSYQSVYIADAGAMSSGYNSISPDAQPLDFSRTPTIQALTWPDMKEREVDLRLANAAAYDVVAVALPIPAPVSKPPDAKTETGNSK